MNTDSEEFIEIGCYEINDSEFLCPTTITMPIKDLKNNWLC